MVLLHLALVVLTAAVVLIADEQGLSWVLGKKEMLSKRRIEILHALVSVGLAGIILTGGLMFLDRIEYLLSQPTFLIKMGFVAALVVNGLLIGYLSRVATTRSYSSLSFNERLPFLICGGISVGGWVGAIVCGLLLSAL